MRSHNDSSGEEAKNVCQIYKIAKVNRCFPALLARYGVLGWIGSEDLDLIDPPLHSDLDLRIYRVRQKSGPQVDRFPPSLTENGAKRE